MTEMPVAPPGLERSRARRLGRALLWVLGGVLGLVLIGAMGSFYLLGHLDSPLIKGPLRAALRARGLELDYDRAQAELGRGLDLKGIRLRNVAPYDAIRPDLLRIGELEVRWDPKALTQGASFIEALRVRDLSAHLVITEAGDSFSAWLAALTPSAPTEPGPPSPPSRLLSQLLADPGAPLPRVVVEGLAIEVVRVEPGGGQRIARARGGLSITVEDRQRASLALALDLVSQDLLPELGPVAELLRVEGEVRFLPAEERIGIRMDRVALLDRLLVLEATLSLPDRGERPPLLKEARLELAAARLTPLVPAELGRIFIEGDPLILTARQLELAARPQLRPDGAIDLEGRLIQVRFEREAERLSALGLVPRLHARPGKDQDRLQLQLELSAERVEATMAALSVAAKGPSISLALGLEGVEPRQAQLDLGWGGLELRAASGITRAGGGELSLGLSELALSLAEPLASRGVASLRATLSDVIDRRGSLTARVRGLRIEAESRLTGSAPYALRARIPIRQLMLSGRKGRVLLPARPAHIELAIEGVRPDWQDLQRTALSSVLDVDFGGVKVHSDNTKGAEEMRFDTRVEASSLALVGHLLGASGGALPWPSLALGLRTAGTIRGWRSPATLAVDQHSTVSLRGLRLASGIDAALPSIDATLATRGGLRRHEAELGLDLAEVRLRGRALGRARLEARLALDVDHPRVSLHLEGKGGAGPVGKAELSFSFDRGTRVLAHRVEAELSQLGLLGLFWDAPGAGPGAAPGAGPGGLQWEGLELSLRSQGELRGVLEKLSADGVPTLDPAPLRHLRGKGHLELGLAGLKLRPAPATRVGIDRVRLKAELDASAARRVLSLDGELPRIELRADERRVVVHGLVPHLEVESRPSGGAEEGSVLLELGVRRVEQNATPYYPIADVKGLLRLRGDTRGRVRLEEGWLRNPAGGTALELSGGIDLTAMAGSTAAPRGAGARASEGTQPQGGGDPSGDPAAPVELGRRAVLIEGKLIQLLEPLSGARQGDGPPLSARGRVQLPFRIESGDLRLFHSEATLAIEHLWLAVKGSGFLLEDAVGRLPLRLDLARDPQRGWRLLERGEELAYPQLRFFDHQPFFAEDSFFSVRELRSGDLKIGPLAGNLRIERGVMSLDQLEASLLGGKITGQCRIALRGLDSEVELRGGVTGLQPRGSSDPADRLDANAALTIVPYRLRLEGRVELVHVGRRHLLNLIDAWDPYRADVSANRARLALKLGYPESVRLRFEQGFASLRLRLGGAARAVRIDELRGVPVGPLLQKYLGPILPPGGAS